jgi:excisionase family DNA binding protein
MSSNLRVPKSCIYCGKRFVAATFTTKYCSHICNRRHYKELKKAEKLSDHLLLEKNATDQEVTADDNKRQSNNSEFLSITEAAELLGVSSRTILRQIEKGTIRIAKIGRRTIIARTEIDKLFN